MAEIVRRRSWGGVLPLGRHVSISGSSFIHAPSVSIAPSSFQEEQNARHHKQFKLEQALASAVAFSITISSNPAQTSTGGPSQTCRPNQPETVSLLQGLGIRGSVDARQLADLKIRAVNVPTGESRTTVASADIRHLALEGRITGALTAPTIDATLTAETARLPAGRLGKVDATFKATPTGDASASGPLIQLTADARATGLALTDKALAQAVGTEASLRLRGTGTLNGPFTFETLELKSPTITGQFAGRAGSSEVQGHLGIAAPDLAKFGDVAGLGLRGSAKLSAEVEGTPRANRFNVKIDGHATQFATGIAAVDGLFGGRLDVRGGVRLEPNGSVGFDGVRFSGAHAQGSIAGTATPERADVAVALTIPTLARADDRLTGRAEIDAKLTGTLEHPGAM